jgi:hypothetical protein
MGATNSAWSSGSGVQGMRISSNGSIGIGTTAPKSNVITIKDGEESVDLTVAMIKSLQEIRGFLDHAEKCGSEVGDLWRAYKAANKLEK